jgi:cobalt-precorrin-5B (C1)-methyltransferase
MRSGYTLPVFATASAIAALTCLQQSTNPESTGEISAVNLDLITPSQQVEIAIEQVALIHPGMALGITRSDPGDNLDLTRDTPIWAVVEWADPTQVESIVLVGGEGVGKQSNLADRAAIYSYAQQLLQTNLARLLTPDQKIRVTIILPAGRTLATRTSNAAFGVVEGLSLLGTTGISQPLSAPGQLDLCLAELRFSMERLAPTKVGQSGTHPQPIQGGEHEIRAIQVGDPPQPPLKSGCNHAEVSSAGVAPSGGAFLTPPFLRGELEPQALAGGSPLVFCIGENGLDLAQKMGIDRERIIKTANWLGPLLAEAGVLGIPKLLLFGYHGKLVKLAAGIFHTHHHLADGRLETLVAAAARMGLAGAELAGLFERETAEDVLKYLHSIDLATGTNWVDQIYGYLADQIDTRSQTYIYSQTQQQVTVGSVLFDRQRQVIVASPTGKTFLTELC